MSLKDKRDQLARSKDKQDNDTNSTRQDVPQAGLRGNLKERQKVLADEVARQNRLRDLLGQGEKFYQDALDSERTAAKESLLLSAKNMFEAAMEVETNNALAREGMIRVLNAFGENARRTKRYKMALDYYETLEKQYDEPTAKIFIEEIKRLIEKTERYRKIGWIGGGILAIVILGLLTIQGLHLIAWPMKVCNGIGGEIICLPTPTPTATLAPTATPTLPFTPTPSLTPTATQTITLTPTPFVYQGKLNFLDSLVPYYPDPTSTMPSGFESNEKFVYVCAKDLRSNRYLVSLDYCFSTHEPFGWVNQKALVLIFEGDLPADLTTPSK